MEYRNLSLNPVEVIIQLVGSKWKILVINELLERKMRFNELKKSLGCTSKILIKTLKELEEDGFLIREKYNTVLPKVEYYLTDIGYTTRPIIESMRKWGRDYRKLRKLMLKETNYEN